MVYEGFFWKILLQLLPINKQRPKSKCLCKTGTKFLRMKLHLVLKWSPQRCLLLLLPASPYQERQTEKANENISPHSLRQWKGVQSRMQQIWGVSREAWLHVHPFRNGWEGRLLTEGVLEMKTGATAPDCCHDGTRAVRPLGFPWTDRRGWAQDQPCQGERGVTPPYLSCLLVEKTAQSIRTSWLEM